MLVTKLTVKIHRGLQARNTALFVDKASSFTSDVILTKSGISSDGKKIMRVMDLNIKDGDEIMLMVNGCDEHVTFKALKSFLMNQL
ncbi:HPr family phosphocarrier protein [Terribacillus saccharophilus]|uniref:HPr family phosphocarrier protein n=1 Tax=Terribacillus saccharophilus TaxID=361277 RepID=A0A268ACF6_9BACI|nr:HPr family phosphocarrier protein [Terribacillus saccharophilus]PAD21806.1 HPr family phosphocarrier protein [Terribacillus saccharophilus]PAF19787.1 HPr family phosphocarrier protein [Terribacillus saccharophilus]PAF21839.1 HPr family phosphocarrier protein [Terribacillus saccharophilus]PAF34541.1 HPr family phosphocarrier protein [Terribacillus saccharophilus]